jgi:hypothetical protein
MIVEVAVNGNGCLSFLFFSLLVLSFFAWWSNRFYLLISFFLSLLFRVSASLDMHPWASSKTPALKAELPASSFIANSIEIGRVPNSLRHEDQSHIYY